MNKTVRNKMIDRPSFIAEEFVATRILQYVGMSGSKEFEKLKFVVPQECRGTRWGVASEVLCHRIDTKLYHGEKLARVYAVSDHECKKQYGTGLPKMDEVVCDAFYIRDAAAIGPRFHIVRMGDVCKVAYAICEASQLDKLDRGVYPVTLYRGTDQYDLVVSHTLKSFLDILDMTRSWVAEEFAV